jgi:predicted nucleotidyltransferase
MKDHTHFITKDNLIFTTRGDHHEKGYIRAAAIYFPNKNGEKFIKRIKFEKEIDEFGDGYLKAMKPEYVRNDDEGNYILVPKKDILKVFEPYKALPKQKIKIKRKFYGLLRILRKIVPKKDIGLIGSYLIGFANKSSDIDIIVRGKENMKKIKKNMPLILDNLNSKNFLNEKKKIKSIIKYENKYNKENNDFSEMIDRRWPTISNNNYLTKIRFSYDKKECPEIRFNKFKEEIKIEGIVIDDIGTNFMPRSFIIKSKNKKFIIYTYFWDFTYCVKKGDFITVKGSLFDRNKILICKQKEHGIKFRN